MFFFTFILASSLIFVNGGITDCLQSRRPKISREECCPGITPSYAHKSVSCAGYGFSAGVLNPLMARCDMVKCTLEDYLTSDDKLNGTAFVTGMLVDYTDNAYKKLVQPAYDKCASKPENESERCPLAGFSMCFLIEMFKTCPDNGNEDCAAAKELIEKCHPTS